MSAAHKGSFSAADVGWLLGGQCNLRAAAGPLDWQDQNRNYVAAIPLQADGFTDDEARLTYRIGKLRASEPTLLIALRGHCVYRMDVNGTHLDGTKLYQFVTHVQRRRSSADPSESFEPNPLGVPAITLGQRVQPHEYRSLLSAFAAPIGMDILDIQWNDPPEGRQP